MKNSHGIEVRECCASCRHKDLTRLISSRFCLQHHKSVKPKGHCKEWAMSEQLEAAGSGRGKVKRKDYLMFVLATQLREDEAKERGEEVEPMSLADIREEFEAMYGDIYVEI